MTAASIAFKLPHILPNNLLHPQELAAKEENIIVSLSHKSKKFLDNSTENECILENLLPGTITYNGNSWPRGDVLNGLHATIKRREGINVIVELDTGEVDQ